MDRLLEGIRRIQERLIELETVARKLENQNFADIIKSAIGRVNQAIDHPDLGKVADQFAELRNNEEPPLPFGQQAPGNIDDNAGTYDTAGT